MQINEIVRQTGLSRRAIKYYEEAGLLRVGKDANGYRNYGEGELTRLKEIAVYRKFGISVGEIQGLLEDPEKRRLEAVCAQKEQALGVRQKELDALRRFMENKDVGAVYDAVAYEDLAAAMQARIPGFFGQYLAAHFLPYLKMEISSQEQQAAYERIISFWNQTEIKVPLLLRATYFFLGRGDVRRHMARVNEQMQRTITPTPEEYARLREQIRQQVANRQKARRRWNPIATAQRRLMKNLQDCGYNDLFLPDMMLLSPAYREYHDALAALNTKLAQDIGLHYDAAFHPVTNQENTDEP